MPREAKPDLIIQRIDAKRLKQTLFLTADLVELGIPMVISLDAIDETTRRGISSIAVWKDVKRFQHAAEQPSVAKKRKRFEFKTAKGEWRDVKKKNTGN